MFVLQLGKIEFGWNRNMITPEYEQLAYEFEPDEDPQRPLSAARDLLNRGHTHSAATFYHRAYGLDPNDHEIETEFKLLLDDLAIQEHGINWRYVPGGVFLMGNNKGEPDEKPWHPVWLNHYWVMETCLSWAQFEPLFDFGPSGRIRSLELANHPIYSHVKKRQYEYELTSFRALTSQFSGLDALHPLIGISYELATLIGEHLTLITQAQANRSSTPNRSILQRLSRSKEKQIQIDQCGVVYRLPFEAEWEKAARGGLIGAPYPWGWEATSEERIDCDRFHQFKALPLTHCSPNSFGLYGMCGGVWEWTRDYYDSLYYSETESFNPIGPGKGELRVIRGGSWADCPEACTVSFRSALRTVNRSAIADHFDVLGPTIGMRLVRTESKELDLGPTR